MQWKVPLQQARRLRVPRPQSRRPHSACSPPPAIWTIGTESTRIAAKMTRKTTKPQRPSVGYRYLQQACNVIQTCQLCEHL